MRRGDWNRKLTQPEKEARKVKDKGRAVSVSMPNPEINTTGTGIGDEIIADAGNSSHSNGNLKDWHTYPVARLPSRNSSSKYDFVKVNFVFHSIVCLFMERIDANVRIGSILVDFMFAFDFLFGICFGILLRSILSGRWRCGWEITQITIMSCRGFCSAGCWQWPRYRCIQFLKSFSLRAFVRAVLVNNPLLMYLLYILRSHVGWRGERNIPRRVLEH